jgi:hypothetical protein
LNQKGDITYFQHGAISWVPSTGAVQTVFWNKTTQQLTFTLNYSPGPSGRGAVAAAVSAAAASPAAASAASAAASSTSTAVSASSPPVDQFAAATLYNLLTWEDMIGSLRPLACGLDSYRRQVKHGGVYRSDCPSQTFTV